MRTVTVIGTLVTPTEFEIFGHPIKVTRAPIKKVGKRLKLEGFLCHKKDVGAFLQVVHYEETDLKDSNLVTVSGTVIGVMTEQDHPRHGKTACVVLRQSRAKASRALVTVPSRLFKELDVSNLSTGDKLCVTGYLGYHNQGLHVFLVRREVDVSG